MRIPNEVKKVATGIYKLKQDPEVWIMKSPQKRTWFVIGGTKKVSPIERVGLPTLKGAIPTAQRCAITYKEKKENNANLQDSGL